jgi:sortase A
MEHSHERPRRRTVATSLRWVVGALGELAVTLGLLILLFTAWQLWWTDVVADHAQAGTIRSLSRDFGAGGGGGAPQTDAPPRFGKAFAILRIPRFGSAYARPILEGTGRDILRQGVGHYDGTALPGADGNFAVAGHRTTYGRPFHDIDRLRSGDTIVVETKAAFYVYRVQSHEIVDPSDVAVIAPLPDRPGVPADGAWMTMTACHPKYSAAKRYVVHARLAGTYTRAQGLPAGTLDRPKDAS